MKKEKEFPYERIPAFVVYGIVAACAVGCFIKGISCLFAGMVFYIIGMMLDPKSDLYDQQ